MPSGKYFPVILKDEAVALAGVVGVLEASRQTGVGVKTINKHKRALRLAAGIKPDLRRAYNRKYTTAQKLACIALAAKIRGNGYTRFRQSSFRQAGAILKVNGMSIYRQWTAGDIYGESPLIQQERSLF